MASDAAAKPLATPPAGQGFTHRLYWRVWFAAVLALLLLSLTFAWLWQANTERLPPPREVLVRNVEGQVIGRAEGRPIRIPGQGVEFPVQMTDGSTVLIHLPPRQHEPGRPPPPRPWFNGPMGLVWLLTLVAVTIAVGLYPVVRWITLRLEKLRTGVARWGDGDLAARVEVQGRDEVAFLATQFNLAAEQVEKLVGSHRVLLANASHELRSPLARIRMALELMDGQPTAAVRAELVHNVAELDQLIDEILLSSRLDTNQADMGTVESVDLIGVVAEEAARTDATLNLVDPGQSIEVQGVSRLLRRMVRNLLENAQRHGKGEVIATLSQDANHVRLEVGDRGPGVPPALQDRIFDPFFRLPGASERDGGVGLGLSLVKSIVERHHGRVRCENRLGGGALFMVELPRK